MTNPLTLPSFWSFPGRPERRDKRSGDPSWRDHPLAQAVDAPLAERGLDEWDIELFVDGQLLYAITSCWPYVFLAGSGGPGNADVATALGSDLDHLVAWHRRDAMIAPTTGTPARAGAIGRRLGELGTFPTRPALLAGLDAVMTKVREVGRQLTHAMVAGLLVQLEIGTETLADIPATALAVVGDLRQRVPRSEKPWLAHSATAQTHDR